MKIVSIVTRFSAALIVAGVLFTGCSKSSNHADKAAPAAGANGSNQQAPSNHSYIVVTELKAKLKDNPRDVDTLVRIADAYFEMKQFDEAINYYKQVLAVKPDDVETYNELGLSSYYFGKTQEGLNYLEEGLKKNPYHQRTWLTKGFILATGLSDLKGARAAWEKAKTLNPETDAGKAAAGYLLELDKKQ